MELDNSRRLRRLAAKPILVAIDELQLHDLQNMEAMSPE